MKPKSANRFGNLPSGMEVKPKASVKKQKTIKPYSPPKLGGSLKDK